MLKHDELMAIIMAPKSDTSVCTCVDLLHFLCQPLPTPYHNPPPPRRTLALHLSGGLLSHLIPPSSFLDLITSRTPPPLCPLSPPQLLILSFATLRLLSYPSPTKHTSWLLLLLPLLPSRPKS